MWKDREEARVKTREYVRKKVEAGICARCTKPQYMGRTLCKRHWLYKRDMQHRLNTEARRKAGIKPRYPEGRPRQTNVQMYLTMEEAQWHSQAKKTLNALKQLTKGHRNV